MADLLNEPTRARPSLIQNNRLGGVYTGDTETPEQTIPANGFPGRDWETCMTMNDTWGYTSDDQNWKPTKVLIHNLIDIASKNGNYLLNVGPTAEGVVPAPSVERLQEVGGWMRVNGEAIHGTQGIPLAAPLAWGRLTWRPGRVYAHVLDWPKDGTISLPLDRKVKRARLLANPAQEIPVQIQPNVNGGAGAVLSLPPQAPDPVATVVALELDLPVVKQAHDGSLTLMAGDSDSSPELVREAIDGGPLNIGWWVSVRSSVTWRALVERPGVYEVVLQYACMPEAGGPFVLRSGSATLQAAATPTTSWRDFREATVGQIKLDQKGEVAIEIRAAKDSNSGLMNLRALVLRPRTGWHPGDARTTTESNSEIGVHHRKP
jgi:alpha-L-fucosidase